MLDKNRSSESLQAPSRVLLWMVAVAFFLMIIAALAGLSYFAGGQRLISLFPFAGLAFMSVIVAAIGSAVAFRRHLPRLLWLWITFASAIFTVLTLIGLSYAYRNILPPRYREQLVAEISFMRLFLPPTAEGGVLPTLPPRDGAISPDDLLSGLPILATTGVPLLMMTTSAEVTEQATSPQIVFASTQTSRPSLTPTGTPSLAPPTPAPLQQATTAPPLLTHPSSARIYGITYVKQGWNNCGPANITMALSYYGWREVQDFAANLLKPNPEDKNVSPAEMVNFVRTQTQVSAITRIGGDIALVKDFIAANIPIIIETGYSLEGEDWLGHYRTIVGYDDSQGVFYIYDSWLGTGTGDAGISEHYSDFDARWQNFNRLSSSSMRNLASMRCSRFSASALI